MLSSPNATQLPRISVQIFNHYWFVADIFPGFPERQNKPAFWREALLLVFTAVSHLFKEQFLLRRSREQHELQIHRYLYLSQIHTRISSVGRWFLFLSSPPAWSKSSEAQIFQVNKQKSPEAAKRISHSLCMSLQSVAPWWPCCA